MGRIDRGLALALVVVASFGCETSRFPVCHSNADCAARDAGPSSAVCYNLRCVACHYDGDCAPGEVCNRKSECEPLGGPSAEAPPKTEPTTWDECASTCRDEDCIGRCNQRFQ